jgi:hypothetical protein
MMRAEPRVAIVILQWHRADETAACLRSLAGLDYRDYAVLVVDNHSADGSVERLRAEFPDITIRENAVNLGFAGGCNVGIETVLADNSIGYVLLLNNDTRVAADMLTHMVAAAEATPDAVAVGAMNIVGDRHTSSGGRLDWWTGRYVDAVDERGLAAVSARPVLDVDVVSGSSMLIRAEALRGEALLDAAFFCVFEETDWCLRWRARGRRVVLATRARLEHRVGSTMGKPLHLYFRFRNRPYFMSRHARPMHWCTFLPFYLAEAIGRITVYAVTGSWANARGVLLGVWDAARATRGPGRLAQFVR